VSADPSAVRWLLRYDALLRHRGSASASAHAAPVRSVRKRRVAPLPLESLVDEEDERLEERLATFPRSLLHYLEGQTGVALLPPAPPARRADDREREPGASLDQAGARPDAAAQGEAAPGWTAADVTDPMPAFVSLEGSPRSAAEIVADVTEPTADVAFGSTPGSFESWPHAPVRRAGAVAPMPEIADAEWTPVDARAPIARTPSVAKLPPVVRLLTPPAPPAPTLTPPAPPPPTLTPPALPPRAERDASPEVEPERRPAASTGGPAEPRFELPNPWLSPAPRREAEPPASAPSASAARPSVRARVLRGVALLAVAACTGIGVRSLARAPRASSAGPVAAPAASSAAPPVAHEGELEIRGAPGAPILVDGKQRGDGPVLSMKVTPGYHVVRVGDAKTKLVEVHAGQSSTVDLAVGE
jgi:hypothetical protein